MILLAAGQKSSKGFDATLLFAAQLAERGHQVAIGEDFLPDTLTRHQKFEAAQFLADLHDITVDTVLIIGAEDISSEVQLLLRACPLAEGARVLAMGRFTPEQDQVTAQNKLAYATGLEPVVVDLTAQQRRPLIDTAVTPLATVLEPTPVQLSEGAVRLFVYVPMELLEEPETLSDLAALNQTSGIELHVITSAKGKDMIRQSRYGAMAVHGYGELPPSTLVSYTDIAAFFGTGVPGERMAQYATEAMGKGKVVIDSTSPGTFAASGAPVLRGPEDLVGLSLYLQDVVLDNRIEIGRRIQQGEWLRDHDIAALETALGLVPGTCKDAHSAPKSVFFPTNGNGMGHAQRCALIAEELPKDSLHCFAAFPSCVDMLRERGFDCMPMVQRSEDHQEIFANDLVNYLRLNRLLNAGDQLVFDGGYVFDSVYRLIAAKQSRAVWIRRGLWQASQVHDTALEREHVFSRVIVPREAFSELNTDYSFGKRVYPVGPVVNRRPATAADVKSRRNQLAKHLDHPFETLVVSMLGGGVASDRSAQLQMMCSLMDQRPNCLHLVVVWPGAVVPNGVYGWKNTRLVRTRHALELCQSADLTLSAAGYNSFHELLYAQVPTIFIPQSAPFLDDQEKRAMAATERGLSVALLGNELLQLRREVDAFLDQGKAEEVRAALRAWKLPAPGNAQAAELIAEGLSR